MSSSWMGFVRFGWILSVPLVVPDTFNDFDAGARGMFVDSEI